MKKTLLIVVIILVVLIALPAINFIRWNFQPKKPINIILVDNTVLTLERVNHKSFNWILNNERFVKKGKKTSYSYKKDYYGFFPKRPIRERKSERKDIRLKDVLILADSCDALYFTDTYGIFANDWWGAYSNSRRSRKIYGGLDNNDGLLINEMKKRNKLIILEYNSFDYPTTQFYSERTQEKLGIHSSGWTGKYFSSLDSTTADFPVWITSMYRKQYNKPWTFTKPGIVALTEKEIIVLEQGTHLKDAMPRIITDTANCAKYGVAAEVAFDKWFDIIDPMANNVISKFRIETTPVGDTLLLGNGLSSEFPAVIQEPVSRRTYYFTGDFANSDIPVWTSRFKGVDKLKGILYSEKPDDTRRFFWLYYKPMINTIFTDYYNSMTSTK
jgi:hypothetical protein